MTRSKGDPNRTGVGAKRMAVRVLAPLLVLCLALFVTGCKIQIGLDTVVKENGSGTFGLRLAADKEIQDLMASQGGGGDLFGDLKQSIPEGWKVEEGTDADGTKWVKATVAFKDQEELKKLLQSGGEGPVGNLGGSNIEITQKRSLFSVVTTYKATMDLGTAMEAIGEGAGEQAPVEMLSSIIQFENRVTLPGSIKSHNATEVSGNTLIWRPAASGVAEMNAESSALRWGVVGGFIGGGVVIVAIIIAVVVLLVRRGRRQVPEAAMAPAGATAAGWEPTAPAAPFPPAAEAPAPAAAVVEAGAAPEPAAPESGPAPEPAQPEASPEEPLAAPAVPESEEPAKE